MVARLGVRVLKIRGRAPPWEHRGMGIVNTSGSLYRDNTMTSTPAVETNAGTRARRPRPPRPVPAVTRALAILRLLGRSEEPLGVNAIARALELIPSTALHILRVLVAEELVAFDPVTKRYRLDAGL